MGQNSSKKKELVTLLDQLGSDPRLSEKMQLILDVKNAESFKDFLPKSKNATAEKDIALALIYQATVEQMLVRNDNTERNMPKVSKLD